MDDQATTGPATAEAPTAVAAGAPTDAAAEPAPDSLDEALGANGQLIEEIQQSLETPGAGGTQPVSAMDLAELNGSPSESATMRDLDLLADVEVEVAVEFGRTRLPLRQLLMLKRGSLVELSRRPEQQVTVLANGTPVARGDIVVVDDQVGVHIVELVDPTAPGPPLATPSQVDVQAPAPEPTAETAAEDASEDASEGDT